MSLIPYDDRDGFIWFDGKLVPWREAKVHFLTHCMHYGSGVFEGLRAYGGTPFKLTEHSQRMLDGCQTMDMKIPYDLQQINQACLETVRANKITDGYIRPLAWRGAEQMGVSATKSKIHFAVAAWEWPYYFTSEVKEKGIRLKRAKWRRPPEFCAPVHAKAAGLYMICTLSKNQAELEGYHDALMLDYRGYVAELTSANFFIVKNGEIHTPTPDCFLNGITRQTVIQLAKDSGIKVIERHIMPEELDSADECFATGTAVEVAPIGHIEGRDYKVGPISRLMLEKYEKLVRQAPAKSTAA